MIDPHFDVIMDVPRMWYQPDVSSWRRRLVGSELGRQCRAVGAALALPERPRWRRYVQMWVATPAGFFAIICGWVLGVSYFGPVFFLPWMAGALLLPASILYVATKDGE